MSSRAHIEVIYHEMARYVLMGLPKEDISQHMAVPIPKIERWLRHPDFKKILHDVQSKALLPTDRKIRDDKIDVHSRIQEAAEQSMDVLEGILNAGISENVKAHVAQDMLDRAGHTDKTATKPPVFQINVLDAAVINVALAKEKDARELLAASGKIIDATPARELKHPIVNPGVDPGEKHAKEK